MRSIAYGLGTLILVAGFGAPARAQQPTPMFLGSISGRLVDAATGQPLSSNTTSSAGVLLRRCRSGACTTVPLASASSLDGRFRIASDLEGNRIRSGTLQLTAFATNHEPVVMDLAVAQDQNLDLGAVSLAPTTF